MRLLLSPDNLADAVVGAVQESDPTVAVERVAVHPVHRGFPSFVNDGLIDISEVALVTLLQAVASGRPVALLPVTVLGRFQHHTLVSGGEVGVADLPGARVGVRSWTQTTGVWMRGALAQQYEIDLRAVRWITYAGGHVSGYSDPEWVQQAAEGTNLVNDLLEGRLDAAIIGNDLPAGAPVHPLIDDPQAAAMRWAQETGCVPINHVMGVRHAFAQARPDLVRAAYRALCAETAEQPMSPGGFDQLRQACSVAAAYALDQQILSRAVSFEELVGPLPEILGHGR